jgi:RimJ/RimL family protein N-acetyltransferase
VRIRRAAPEDAAELAELFGAVVEEGGFVLTEHPFDRVQWAERVARTLADGEATMLVCEDAGGALIGHLGIHPAAEPGVADIGISVAAPARGLGAGRALMDAAAGAGRAMGLHKLALEVFPENLAAVALYAGLGWEVEGRYAAHHRRADGTLRDVLVMGLWL